MANHKKTFAPFRWINIKPEIDADAEYDTDLVVGYF